MSRPDHAESSRPSGEGAGDSPGSPKKEQRHLARIRRAGWPPEERARWSAAIVDRLRDELPASGMVATYAAMGDELDLGALDAELIDAGRLCFPRVEAKQLVMVPVTATTEFVRSRFGVAEPLGEPVGPEALAAVVVPGLAFDRSGMRIGYGAGFYDRYLPTVSAGCRVIGACFAGQLIPTVPADAHDVAVDAIVTETETVRVTRAR